MIGPEDVDSSVEVAKERAKKPVKSYFNCGEEEWKKKLVNHDYVMRKIEGMIPKIIFAELGEEGGADLLKHKIHYHRKRAASDPVEEIQLAETLVEYAEMLWEGGNTSPARKHVKEAIGICENYLQKWDDRDTRGDLEAAKELLKQIGNAE